MVLQSFRAQLELLIKFIMQGTYELHCAFTQDGGGGGGGFVPVCEDFGRMFDNSFPSCAFFFKW